MNYFSRCLLVGLTLLSISDVKCIQNPSNKNEERINEIQNKLLSVQTEITNLNTAIISGQSSGDLKIRVNSVEDQLQSLTEKFIDELRQEKDSAGKFDISIGLLSNQHESLQNQLKSLQTNIAEKLKLEHEGDLPVEIQNAIKSQRFWRGEEKLVEMSDITKIPGIVHDVYANSMGNINLLLDFARTLSRKEFSLAFLKALVYETRANGHRDPYKLIEIARTLESKELTNGEAVSLRVGLVNDIRSVAGEIFKNAIYSETFAENVEIEKLTSALNTFRPNLFEEVLIELIEGRYSVPASNKFLDSINSLSNTSQAINGIVALFYNLERSDNFNNSTKIKMCDYLKQLQNRDGYIKISDMQRNTLRDVVSKLPNCTKVTFIEPNVCIQKQNGQHLCARLADTKNVLPDMGVVSLHAEPIIVADNLKDVKAHFENQIQVLIKHRIVELENQIQALIKANSEHPVDVLENQIQSLIKYRIVVCENRIEALYKNNSRIAVLENQIQALIKANSEHPVDVLENRIQSLIKYRIVVCENRIETLYKNNSRIAVLENQIQALTKANSEHRIGALESKYGNLSRTCSENRIVKLESDLFKSVQKVTKLDDELNSLTYNIVEVNNELYLMKIRQQETLNMLKNQMTALKEEVKSLTKSLENLSTLKFSLLPPFDRDQLKLIGNLMLKLSRRSLGSDDFWKFALAAKLSEPHVIQKDEERLKLQDLIQRLNEFQPKILDEIMFIMFSELENPGKDLSFIIEVMIDYYYKLKQARLLKSGIIILVAHHLSILENLLKTRKESIRKVLKNSLEHVISELPSCLRFLYFEQLHCFYDEGHEIDHIKGGFKPHRTGMQISFESAKYSNRFIVPFDLQEVNENTMTTRTLEKSRYEEADIKKLTSWTVILEDNHCDLSHSITKNLIYFNEFGGRSSNNLSRCIGWVQRCEQ